MEGVQDYKTFASLNKDEMDLLFENVDSKNTKRQTHTAVKLFREYLTEKSLPLDFETLGDDQLDEILSNFYLEMRNKNGQLYKKSTMNSYRQGLQRHLSQTRNIDILKGEPFKKSIKAFKCIGKELKRVGLAVIDHYPPINDVDLQNMYGYFSRNIDDPQVLQYKVFVDIMIHFGRRGRENLANLTRKDFAVQQDSAGMMFVYKTTDERTKNHQNDSEKSADGRMYEIKDSDRCPVRSFVNYIRKLNPKFDKLFQKARSTPVNGICYNNVPLGHNTLGTFMAEISRAAHLSREYTNPSCRATTVHLLDEAKFPGRHIMSVTGHKSETSLKTYSGKTSENIKKDMSKAISEKTLEITEKTDSISTTTRAPNVLRPTALSSNIDFVSLSEAIL